MIKTIILFLVFIGLLFIPLIFSCADIAKKSDILMDQIYLEYLKMKHKEKSQQN